MLYLDSDLTCPGCSTENISLEALVPDEDIKTKIKEYQNEKSNEKQIFKVPPRLPTLQKLRKLRKLRVLMKGASLRALSVDNLRNAQHLTQTQNHLIIL